MIKKLSHMDETEADNYDGVTALAFDIARENKGERLYCCTATIYKSGEYIVLKSYNTPIALFAVGTHNTVLYDFLRTEYGYTSTSSQHICKFRKWLKEKGLYNDSTVNVRFIP